MNVSAYELIQEDRQKGIFRVNRQALTSDDVLALERERIFKRCWLYLGHASEVRQPGDFVMRKVMGRPIIFNRDRHGELRAFYNTCPHRGAQVCRERAGSAKSFQCAYHGWTFDNDGILRGVPGRESYPADFNANGMYDLPEVQRLDSYCDFVFVNFDAGAEPLEDYLAGAKDYLQLIALQSAVGMEVIAGTQEYHARANWKLLLENSADGYHALTMHATYFDYLKERDGKAASGKGAAVFNKPFGQVLDLGNGHSVSESEGAIPWGRPIARFRPGMGEPAREAIEEVCRQLVDRLGEARARVVAEKDFNMLVFPNLAVLNIMAVTVRTFYPLAPDRMDVRAWALGPRDEAAALRDLRMRNFVEFLGPAGFATPDDVEMLELCQEGYQCQPGADWNDLSRGMLTEHEHAAKQDELQMRNFWRRWRQMLVSDARVSFRIAS